MAFLTELQVAELKQHMTDDLDVLALKYKAKSSKTDNVSVSHSEREGYEGLGYEVTHTMKKKVKMSRPKKAGDMFEDDIWCMFYKLGFRCLNSDENLTIPWGDNGEDKHQIE